MKDYYYILGVSRTASTEEIKYAYKKLSIKFHPDKNDGDKFFEDRFKEIQEAYDTLKDNFKKSHYDFNLKKGTQSFSNQEKQQPSDSDNRKSSPKILFFNIAPDKVTSGSEITISWAVENAKVISITGLGLVDPIGKRVLKIHNIHSVETKIITLLAENGPYAKSNKEICIRFESPTTNQSKKDKNGNIFKPKLLFARLRKNILVKVLVRISVLVILYYIFIHEEQQIYKDNSEPKTILVSKTKDSFYYDVSQYLRVTNPNISNDEVFKKTAEYRKNPEEFYAIAYIWLNAGERINKRQFGKVSKSVNFKMDFDKIPDHLKEINIVNHDTGDKPFFDCFEKMIQCYKNCSQIVVIAPINSDVVVTVKQGDQVIDHTFISNAETFTFDLENGSYQTYFYFGSGGWDVDKILTTTSCGELYGGFVTDEVFSKAQEENLNSTILTYTLQLTKNGNFQTSPSTVDENF